MKRSASPPLHPPRMDDRPRTRKRTMPSLWMEGESEKIEYETKVRTELTPGLYEAERKTLTARAIKYRVARLHRGF